MAKTFEIIKNSADVRLKDATIKFNTKKQIYEASALVRGDDYDPGDGNYPSLRLWQLSGPSYKTIIDLTPDLLPNSRYKWINIEWDPRTEYSLGTHLIPLIVSVFDEDMDSGGGITSGETVDLSPKTTILTPIADYVEGETGTDTVSVEFRADSIAWKQKFKPKVMRALKEDLSDKELGGWVTHFSLKNNPTTFIAVNVAGGNYIKTAGDTPMASATIDWDEADVYLDEVSTFKASGVGIGTHDSASISVGTKVYFEVDYQAETL